MPGGARLIVVLCACLEPDLVPDVGSAVAPIDATVAAPAHTGAVVGNGRVVGSCPGTGWVEAASADGTVLDRAEVREGRYRLGPMASQPAQLRWGCDDDADGVAEIVASAGVGRVPLVGAVLVMPTR